MAQLEPSVQPAPNTDNEATNCSETMSTYEEDEEGAQVANSRANINYLLAELAQVRDNSAASSTSVRPATPRRATGLHCMQQTVAQDGQEDSSPSEPNTASLANNWQAPPSYGSATKDLVLSASRLNAQNAAHLNYSPEFAQSSNHTNEQQQALFAGRSMIQSRTMESMQTLNGQLMANNQDSSSQIRYLIARTGSLPRSSIAAYLASSGSQLEPPLRVGQGWLDNNQSGCELNRQHPKLSATQMANTQQQQQQTMLVGVPINHVISARKSMQRQQPQTNQYYGTQRRTTPEGLLAASVAARSGGRQSASSNAQELASMAANIMDTNNKACRTIDAAGAVVGNPKLGQDLLAGEHEALNGRKRNSRQTQQARKRRRHRSNPARSLSPQTCDEQAKRQSAVEQQFAANTSRLATQDPLSGYTSTPGHSLRASSSGIHDRQSAKTISAHCWLVDSSDEQSCAPSNSKSAAQHLTVAIMKQAQQQRQQRQQQLQLARLGVDRPTPAAGELTSSLRLNSVRMEKILLRDQQSSRRAGRSRGRHRVRRLSSLSTDDSSSSSQSDSARSSTTCRSQQTQSGTIARLSALLALISGLVRRAPRRAKSAVADSTHVPQPAIQSSLAPYAAASSSSSTSAYATGSSRLSSNSNHHKLARLNQEPAIDLKQSCQLAPSVGSNSVAGSSLFYSTSSGALSKLPSSHGYEYCDNFEPNQHNSIALEETQFGCQLQPVVVPSVQLIPNDNQSDSTVTSLGQPQETCNRPSNPRAVMSDNELISAGSDLNQELTGCAFRASSLAVSSTRRRWCWNRLKDWMRRPCSQKSHCEDAQPALSASQTAEQTEAARYKSLRSRRRPGKTSGGTSTLQNVMSLAKADRIFRIRLIASIIVSCILMALICLLLSLIYNRNGSFYDINKLSANFIDDSDYDLSTLFESRISQSSRSRLSQSNFKNPTRTEHIFDSLLRPQLQMVEQSARLEQWQLTIAHLSSIQLANDNFIDLTQLTAQLVASNQNRQPNLAFNQSRTNSSAQFARHKPRLGQLEHDLISLTLLSNLHWPLVKWRHQNQQSVANFLSFAISPSVGSGATQSLRNLLALLLLAESSQPAPNQQHNLNQFGLLNSLLRSASHQIVSCTYWLERNKLRANLRGRFCKLLINKYKLMMLTLSQLDHNNLAKLQTPESDSSTDSQLFQSSSKTLLGFLLDRLALLDVRMLAEMTLLDHDANLQPVEMDAAIESLLIRDTLLVESRHNQQQQSGVPLSELAKQSIGESPVNLRLNLEKNVDFQVKFRQLELEKLDEWRAQLAADLLHPWSSPRLPQLVSPLSYDLFLHPNLTTRALIGMVKIEFKVNRATRYLLLNSRQLNLVDLTIWLKQPNQSPKGSNRSASVTMREVPTRRVLSNSRLEQIYIEVQDEPLETWTGFAEQRFSAIAEHEQPVNGINFNGEFASTTNQDAFRWENRYVLIASYNKSSFLGDQQESSGLELVQYADYFAQAGLEVKSILYSELEPNKARRLFPCFDEPQLRAKFQLNLVHEQHHQVLFNAAKRERIPYSADGSLQMSVFEQTQIALSTYLVSFVVCDTQNIKSITSRVAQLPLARGELNERENAKHIQVQISAQFEHLSQAEFASQLVPQLLAFYQTQFRFPYPTDKLDLVAIPAGWRPDSRPTESSSDSADNFGLVWLRAPLLLLDSNLISQDLVEQSSRLIAHQLAHQYFGNIIAIKRWPDSWLYQALCQYLEFVALSNVQPEWKLEEQFPVASIGDSLARDQFGVANQMAHPSAGASLDEPNEFGAQESSRSFADHIQDSDLVLSRLRDLVELGADSQKQTRWQSKKAVAVLHMLLFNLLPSQDAQLRLLQRSLDAYAYKSMGEEQFWYLFGLQLLQEADNERLSIDLSSILWTTSKDESNVNLIDSSNSDLAASKSVPERNLTLDPSSQEQVGFANERVVFVRPPVVQTMSDSEPLEAEPSSSSGSDEFQDSHRLTARTSRLSDNLDILANAWLDRAGFPLVVAQLQRDRIQLSQERFSLAWWWSGELSLSSQQSDGELGGHGRWPSANNLVSDESRSRRSLAELSDDVWPIPLTFVSRFNPKSARFLWLTQRQLQLPFSEHFFISSTSQHESSYLLPEATRKGHSSNFWFKLNVNQTSLVRVNYDERNWEALAELLLKSHYSNHILAPLDRANLIDDSLTLMRCGKLSVGVAMNLTLYLEVGEREYQPWMSALQHLDEMQTLLNQNPLWHRYVLKLMQPISGIIGWKDDGPHLMRKLRRRLFSVALQYGDEKTKSKARQEFKSWLKSNRYIVPNLQELVYVAGVRYGDQQEWIHCWQRYQQLINLDLSRSFNLTNLHSDNPKNILPTLANHQPAQVVGGFSPELSEINTDNEKRQLLTALASTHNTWLLEQFLNHSMDATKIEPHHLKHVMHILGKNPVARLYLWRFVRLNWNSLVILYRAEHDSTNENQRTGYYQVLETMIIESTKHFATRLDYEEVKSFFDTKRKQQRANHEAEISWNQSVEKAIQQSLQVIRSNIYWRDYIEPKLTKWLSHFDTSSLS